MKNILFIPETDELIEIEQFLGDPLVPYQTGLPCLHWNIEQSEDTPLIAKSYPDWLKSLGFNLNP